MFVFVTVLTKRIEKQQVIDKTNKEFLIGLNGNEMGLTKPSSILLFGLNGNGIVSIKP